MTTPLDTYRAEFELPQQLPVVKKKCCLVAWWERRQQAQRDAKHVRSMTRHEIDYTIHLRALREFGNQHRPEEKKLRNTD